MYKIKSVKEQAEFKKVKNFYEIILNKNSYFIFQDEQLISFPMKIYKNNDIFIKKESFKIPELSVVRASNVILHDKYCIIKDDIVFKESFPVWADIENIKLQSEYINKFMGLKLNDDNEIIVDDQSKSDVLIEDMAIFISSHTDTAFSHFIFETFAKIFMMPEEFDKKKIKLIVSSTIKKYQLDLLMDFGFLKENIIFKEKKVKIFCTDLIFIESPSHNNLWISPTVLINMRDRLIKKYYNLTINYKLINDVVFFDRKDERQKMREIKEYHFLESLFLDNSLTCLTPGNLNFNEKIFALNTSNCIIGQYGGGTQLAFLCKNLNTKFFIIQSPYFYRSFISYLGWLCGFDVINYIGNKDLLNSNPNNNSSFNIDFVEFDHILKNMNNLFK